MASYSVDAPPGPGATDPFATFKLYLVTARGVHHPLCLATQLNPQRNHTLSSPFCSYSSISTYQSVPTPTQAATRSLLPPARSPTRRRPYNAAPGSKSIFSAPARQFSKRGQQQLRGGVCHKGNGLSGSMSEQSGSSRDDIVANKESQRSSPPPWLDQPTSTRAIQEAMQCVTPSSP